MFKFKRIVIGILAVVLSTSMLTGCSFFSHDYERDYQQEIARVKSYDIENTVSYEDEEDDGKVKNKTVTYTTSARTIYKMDLMEYVNSNASSLSSSFGTDYEGLYKYAAKMLINVELVTNEVDALIDCGNIKWGLTEQNAVKRSIYSVIDNTVKNYKNEILAEKDYEEISDDDDDDTTSTDTTYPVKPDQTDTDVPEEDDTVVWEPDIIVQPGNHGSEFERSLDNEAMRRFLSLIKSRVEDDFRITGDERKNIDAEIEEIDKRIDEQGIASVYPVIGTYPTSNESPFGYIMYYLSGKSIERSQKITALQNYLSDSVTVDTQEVSDRFTTTLNDQKKEYTDDISAFDTAISGGNTTILYYPNANYFYVKHILLPFSDAQKADLDAYVHELEHRNLEDNELDELVNAYRESLVQSIKCYPHVDGEDDLSREMTVNDVMNHVKSVMQPLASSVRSADLAFDDLIYLYNTDPGAFDNNQGYVVKYKLADGESETYMQEFADAAREMRDTLKPGQVLYKPVITDYGVHIMYLASITKPGEVSLYDYTTPGQLETYYDIFEDPIKSARESAAYATWESNVLTYNYNKNSEMFEKNFKDLWAD
ncbi:MAG: hypothetical protein HDT28_00220 [Clostridiales bacterium]|nr:hypothetical protein [Clostridiales bacterium]